MRKTYNPQELEKPLYASWESAGHFRPSGRGDPYCIMIPPPNITGSLHMGHAFQHSIMDCLIRYQRMQGRDVLWQVGADHAGIATQMLVERQLLGQGQSRAELGREAFLEKVWDWKRQSGGEIFQQLRRMGASVDWSRECFTMDPGYSRAVREAFVRLHDDGLIYRGLRMVNWDPILRSAISDLEVVNEEIEGRLYHIRYPLEGQAENFLVVATTRPETLIGDVAVAVHPKDPRYQSLHGAAARLPLTERSIPIICDEHVDPEFGTGCVKITPAHDFQDHEVGKRHSLPMLDIFTEDALLNDQAPEAYRGLDRFAARERMVADLETQGLLAKVEKRQMTVPKGDRSGAVIEPRLTQQWFVAMDALAKPAVETVKKEQVRFVPKSYENLFFAWMREIRDWCISRQLWWGHRIPAWYDPDGGIHTGLDEADARKRSSLPAETPLRQEDDVLETWFSSSLWTFGTLGWPQKTPELARYHPTSALVTGHDIIFFWVARMIMMTQHLHGEVPFHDVYVHGLIRDAQGQKMSKSKGNGLDPLDLADGIDLEALVAKRTANLMQPQMAEQIAKNTRADYPDGISAYGVDALRFTFCALASTGRDIRFDLHRIAGYRNFCNKLWNAAGFVFLHTTEKDLGTPENRSLDIADQWILSRLNAATTSALEAFAGYRFDLVAQTLYDFVWRDYCDWYLELAKPLFWSDNPDADALRGRRHTLLSVLESVLRLLHPIIPFITEALWLQAAPLLGKEGATIMLQAYPDPNPALEHPQANADIKWLQEVVSGIRSIRSEMGMPPGKEIPLLLQGGNTRDRKLVTSMDAQIRRLGRVQSIDWLDTPPPPCASFFVGNLKVLAPLTSLADTEAETARLLKEIEGRQQQLDKVQQKLANSQFTGKAPAAVVAKVQQQETTLREGIEKLQAQRGRLLALSEPEQESL